MWQAEPLLHRFPTRGASRPPWGEPSLPWGREEESFRARRAALPRRREREEEAAEQERERLQQEQMLREALQGLVSGECEVQSFARGQALMTRGQTGTWRGWVGACVGVRKCGCAMRAELKGLLLHLPMPTLHSLDSAMLCFTVVLASAGSSLLLLSSCLTIPPCLFPLHLCAGCRGTSAVHFAGRM